MKHPQTPPQKVHTISRGEAHKSLIIALVSLGAVILLSLLLLFASNFVGKAITPTVAGNAVQLNFDPLERDIIVSFSVNKEINGLYFELEGVGMDICDTAEDITFVDNPTNPSYLQWERFEEKECDNDANIFRVSKATVDPDTFVAPSADGRPVSVVVKLHLKKFIPSSFNLQFKNVYVMNVTADSTGNFNLFNPTTTETYSFVNPAAGGVRSPATTTQQGTPFTQLPPASTAQQPAGQYLPGPTTGQVTPPVNRTNQTTTQENQINTISSDTSESRERHGPSCVPKWQCGLWGYCNATLQQGRSCVDTTKCVIKGKLEVQACDACEESWICSAWSRCSNGRQTRSCVDEHRCTTLKSKPIEWQSCTEEQTYVAPPIQLPKPQPPLPPVQPAKKSFLDLLLQYKWFIIAPLVLLLLVVAVLLFLRHRKEQKRQKESEGFNYDELTNWVQQGLRAGVTPEQLWQRLQQETSWKKEDFEKAISGLGNG
ncbi:hypothetical protein HYX13_03360 [Candidatus Woesearchaeota archaeon]|nr:hypothetical protein [Candidatus Woesearchaeota archaeon]